MGLGMLQEHMAAWESEAHNHFKAQRQGGDDVKDINWMITTVQYPDLLNPLVNVKKGRKCTLFLEDISRGTVSGFRYAGKSQTSCATKF